jgi:hypothetical protein
MDSWTMDRSKMDHALVKIQKIRVSKKWIIHILKKTWILTKSWIKFFKIWIIFKKIFIWKKAR